MIEFIKFVSKRKGFGLFIFFILMTFRMAWQMAPGIVACSLFWFVVILNTVRLYVTMEDKILKYIFQTLITLGILSNAIVTIVNGGYMPVINGENSYSLWVISTEVHKLTFLADRFAGFSIGDIFILTPIIIALVLGLICLVIEQIQKLNRLNKEIKEQERF